MAIGVIEAGLRSILCSFQVPINKCLIQEIFEFTVFFAGIQQIQQIQQLMLAVFGFVPLTGSANTHSLATIWAFVN